MSWANHLGGKKNVNTCLQALVLAKQFKGILTTKVHLSSIKDKYMNVLKKIFQIVYWFFVLVCFSFLKQFLSYEFQIF